jgi:putative OPT family oligopeptide transporter
MNGKDYKPYVPADKVMPEFTATSIVLGIILAVVFGAANAYLGLRVGMTVSASIPAAVISMGIYRMVLRKESILENNMVQTIGSAGEALAAGAIFVLPVLFMWAEEGKCDVPSILELGLTTLCGGILGVAFMVPLRDSLIVDEHATLPYPEGIACSEVLIAGEEGGKKAATVFKGLGLSAVYKFLGDGLYIFPSTVSHAITPYKGAAFGASVMPAMAGVGYICGLKTASYLFCGGLLSWLVIMPLIATFGSDLVLFPATVSIQELYAASGSDGLWANYIRYIGAGAVMTGGIIGMVKIIPMIIKTFKRSMGGFGKNEVSSIRTQQNLSIMTIGIIVLLTALAMWLLPFIPLNLFGALIVIVAGFVFAAVASRIVGTIGCNNNPASGMTIATLLIACLLFRASGQTDMKAMTGIVAIGCIVCGIVCVAADTSQDLKTGFLVGATPRKQQIGELIGCLTSAMFIGAIMLLLNNAWGYATTELPAPTATLMRMVIEGVMGGNLPWNLIAIGVFIALIAEILGIEVLPFGVGMYLPITTTAPILFGALVRTAVEHMKYKSEDEKKKCTDSGVLYCSGLIAGEGVVGIVLALCAVIPVGAGTLGGAINLSRIINLGPIGAIVIFALMLATIFKAVIGAREK